jgi:hypothetical protein
LRPHLQAGEWRKHLLLRGLGAEQLCPRQCGHALDIEQVFHRVGHACQRRQCFACRPSRIDMCGFGEHACRGYAGEGVDVRVCLLNQRQ